MLKYEDNFSVRLVSHAGQTKAEEKALLAQSAKILYFSKQQFEKQHTIIMTFTAKNI